MLKNGNLSDYLNKRQEDLGLSDYEMANRGEMSIMQWQMFKKAQENFELQGGAMAKKLAMACGISTEQLMKNIKKQW